MGEPFPEWSTAIKDWGAAWYFHQYGLGAFFGFLGISIAVSLVRYNRSPGRGRKKVPYIILSLLALFGWSRSLFLTLDAYRSKNVLPISVLNLLWAVGQPCIVTAYALVFIVLRNALCLQRQFQTWYTTRNIALTTVPYFAFALAAELTVSFLPRFKGLPFACQVVGSTLNTLLAFFYSYLSFLLHKKFRNARTVQTPGTVDRGRQIRVIQKICVAIALGGFTISAMQIYAISDIYGTFSEAEFVSAWPWFVFTTVSRLTELYMAILLYVVAVQNSARSRRTDSSFSARSLWCRKDQQRAAAAASPHDVFKQDGFRRVWLT